MKTLYPSTGYTIIEAMIFLVVSVALFGSVVGAMLQQSRRNDFTQSVDDLQVKLQDVLNDVSTGFYPSGGRVQCSYGPTGPVVAEAATEQGSNVQCIFLGKTIHFEPGATAGAFNIYTMVGNRQTALAGGEDVKSIAEARPRLMTTAPGIVESGNLLPGIRITRVINLDGPTDIGGFALVSIFAVKDDNTQTVSGNASRVSLRAVNLSGLTMNPATFAGVAESSSGANLVETTNGILICLLEEGVGGRQASIKIGGDNLSIEKTIDSAPGC